MAGQAPEDAPKLGDAVALADVAEPTHLTGIVLAAGAGTRMGTPKALLHTADGTPWLRRASQLLAAAGCDPVLVVLGARADDARELLPTPAGVVRAVVAADWSEGMSHSLRAGLAAAAAAAAAAAQTSTAALITLVDMPDLPLAVVRRVLGTSITPTSLRQAVYNGRPGHPVLMGSAHWAALTATLTGDRGARGYLVEHGVEEVECADLFDGHDIDSMD
ncbi:molybdenum cofactor cytidylyltransferase/nicotine blue oxidoreductase [Glaciihabitans tibetensis]|uniref:Molybdenum cofactor cytidylyltransferase/nicotine blue oxidoreductase n=2 Tax=Glaciihabitans tibetensis TaxID=1266600 RepID=A0A2T0VFW8_9MICO|nr:molybdenum cofactor cytidylyltransferase/nicotine blue oxidoreductase [Glaciihabitans tibetensis]